jgi:hypothetical protein
MTVNTQQIISILKQSHQLQKDEVIQLLKLHETFPFFQIPKVLLARFEFEKSKGSAKEFLHWAAVTSPDRAWMKMMIESDTPLHFLKTKLEENYDPGFSQRQISNKRLIDLADFEKSLRPQPTKQADPEERAKILKQLGENLHNKPESSVDLQDELTKKSKRPKEHRVEDLIETIKRKEKKEILDEKKKEQIDIIKAFSKKEIKLATIREIEDFNKQTDLSEKSTQLNPSLLSESYAKLLVKQGKKQKAKEIYQKLMVKFPEKSNYFADLIKESDL